MTYLSIIFIIWIINLDLNTWNWSFLFFNWWNCLDISERLKVIEEFILESNEGPNGSSDHHNTQLNPCNKHGIVEELLLCNIEFMVFTKHAVVVFDDNSPEEKGKHIIRHSDVIEPLRIANFISQEQRWIFLGSTEKSPIKVEVPNYLHAWSNSFEGPVAVLECLVVALVVDCCTSWSNH